MEEEQRQPPADAEQVTSDGLLHKLVLTEGAGDLPPKHSRCLVHYVGRLAETGDVFIDTREESRTQEPQTLVAGRHTSYQEVGLNLVVSGMRRGETARVWAAPKYGFGEKGSFSFPTVPPNADLVYELELLDFEAPNEGREQVGMTFEERMEVAERRRQDGNALFQLGQFDEAVSKYRLALSYLNEDMLMQLGDFHFQMAMDLKRPVLLNIAATQLRQEDYQSAITTCSEVLMEDKQNAKALFRRGRARHALGQNNAALADLLAARVAAPHDGSIVREVAAVRKELKEERVASSKVFKAYFDKVKNETAEPLYEEPTPPLTLEASATARLGSRLQQLAALLQHLQHRGLLHLAVVGVALALAWAYHCWQLPIQ